MKTAMICGSLSHQGMRWIRRTVTSHTPVGDALTKHPAGQSGHPSSKNAPPPWPFFLEPGTNEQREICANHFFFPPSPSPRHIGMFGGRKPQVSPGSMWLSTLDQRPDRRGSPQDLAWLKTSIWYKRSITSKVDSRWSPWSGSVDMCWLYPRFPARTWVFAAQHGAF